MRQQGGVSLTTAIEEAISEADQEAAALANDEFLALVRELAAGTMPDDAAPARTSFDYWGPRGLVLDSPVAPGVDYYRLVDNDAEADAAMAAGEPPLHGHRGLSTQELNHQQFLQYEGPNRLFNRTTDGRIESMDDPDNGTFIPIWNSEGATGNGTERERLLENFQRTAPEMLDPPSVLPQNPGVDLAAAFGLRPATADLAAPLRTADGLLMERIMRLKPMAPAYPGVTPAPGNLLDPSRLNTGDGWGDRVRGYEWFRRQGVPDAAPDAHMPQGRVRGGGILTPELVAPDNRFRLPETDMPQVSPYRDERGPAPAPSERTQSLIPLAQAWPALLGQAS